MFFCVFFAGIVGNRQVGYAYTYKQTHKRIKLWNTRKMSGILMVLSPLLHVGLWTGMEWTGLEIPTNSFMFVVVFWGVCFC